MPKLTVIHGGQDDFSAFKNYLIEEQDVNGTGVASAMGFVAFLEEIIRDVVGVVKLTT